MVLGNHKDQNLRTRQCYRPTSLESKNPFRQEIAFVQKSHRPAFGVDDWQIVTAIPAKELGGLANTRVGGHHVRPWCHDTFYFLLQNKRLLRCKPSKISVREIA